MKRYLLILLSALLCLLAVGCSNKEGTTSSDISSGVSPDSEAQSASSQTNAYNEQLRTAVPHNISIRLNDPQETVIELDGLVIDEELASYSDTDTEWYTTEDSVSINGFAFTPAVYTFANGKINSISYYSEDDSTEYTAYTPKYTYSSLANYFNQLYGDYMTRTDEDGNQMCVYWEITVDDTDIYTLELFYFNTAEESSAETSDDSSENEAVVIAVYAGTYE